MLQKGLAAAEQSGGAAAGEPGASGGASAAHDSAGGAPSAPDAFQAAHGTWGLPDKALKAAVKRLRLLNQVAEAALAFDGVRIEQVETEPDPALIAAAEEALRSSHLSAEVKAVPVPRWWGPEADLALLRGAYRLGYGNYAQLREDAQLAPAFALALGVAPRATSRMQKKNKETTQGHQGSDGEEEEDDKEKAEGKVMSGTPGGTSEAQGDYATAFPAQDTLTNRLRRVLDAVLRATGELRGALSTRPASRGARAAPASRPIKPGAVVFNSLSDVSKRRRMELLAEARCFGMPRSEPEWDSFLARVPWAVGLNAQSRAVLQEYCAQLLAALPRSALPSTALPAGDGSAEPAEPPPPPPPLPPLSKAAAAALIAPKAAKELRERLDCLTALRLLPTLSPSPADTLTRAGAKASVEAIPAWWLPGEHDSALARGVLTHGWGGWDAILADPQLPFGAAIASAPDPVALGDPPRVPHHRALARRCRLLAGAVIGALRAAAGPGEGGEPLPPMEDEEEDGGAGEEGERDA